MEFTELKKILETSGFVFKKPYTEAEGDFNIENKDIKLFYNKENNLLTQIPKGETYFTFWPERVIYLEDIEYKEEVIDFFLDGLLI